MSTWYMFFMKVYELYTICLFTVVCYEIVIDERVEPQITISFKSNW